MTAVRRLAPTLFAMLAAIVVAAAALWWWSLPPAPDDFYQPPASVPREPGRLLRQAPFTRDVPAGAQAWRILYTSTDHRGAPALASALVVAPSAPSATPRAAIAWTHGTTGIVAGCAPSVAARPFMHVPALAEALAAGWAFIATDYTGQGTAGAFPYLIGEGEARSALDALRAARALPGLALAAEAVVWGHSQGGHAALWTGMRAAAYAPEVRVVGVAALAPASDLPALMRAVHAQPVGRIMGSYVLHAYAAAYADVRVADYTRGIAALLAGDMARRCLADKRALVSVAQALALGGSVFTQDPTSGALGARLRDNVPAGALPMPVWVAQGAADPLVLPAVQRDYVAARCAAGQPVTLVEYAGRDHLSLVAPDSPLVADLVAWTRTRLAGAPAPTQCSTAQR